MTGKCSSIIRLKIFQDLVAMTNDFDANVFSSPSVEPTTDSLPSPEEMSSEDLQLEETQASHVPLPGNDRDDEGSDDGTPDPAEVVSPTSTVPETDVRPQDDHVLDHRYG